MTVWLGIYFIFLAGGFFLSAALTPLFKRAAVICGFLDRPASESHKGHAAPIPLLGGCAMFSAWIIALAAGYIVLQSGCLQGVIPDVNAVVSGVSDVSERLLWLISGAALAVILGLIDDKWAMKAYVKFAGQLLIALIAVIPGGAGISFFCPLPVIPEAVSVLWFMLLMNAVNFFDNMDGLAVGTIAIAMGFFAAAAGMNQQYFVASFAALNCGVCAGFWLYNTTPASIFMGDSGSHFLGFLAGVSSSLGVFFRTGSSQSRFPVLIPLLILAVPLFDTFMVTLIRALNGKPFWVGDHNHISHRFVKMGFSRKQAVFLVHLLAAAIGFGVFPILRGTPATAAAVAAETFLILCIVCIMQFILSTRESADK